MNGLLAVLGVVLFCFLIGVCIDLIFILTDIHDDIKFLKRKYGVRMDQRVRLSDRKSTKIKDRKRWANFWRRFNGF